jgi:hypothetical protein
MVAIMGKTCMPRLCGGCNALVMLTSSQAWFFRGKKHLLAIRTATKSHIELYEPAPHVADVHGQGPEG